MNILSPFFQQNITTPSNYHDLTALAKCFSPGSAQRVSVFSCARRGAKTVDAGNMFTS
jgi:hypothetical protein